VSASTAVPTNGHAPNANNGTRATPLARRLARERGIDIASLTGSGPNGRISRADLEKAPAASKSVAAAVPIPASSAVAVPEAMADDRVFALYEPDSYEMAPHDTMRKTIARRLVESKSTVPHFYLTIDCNLEKLIAAREELNARAPKEGRGVYKLSVNDFFIKALALALRDVPLANATWTSQGMMRHKRVDVGVAVAVEGGLLTPILRHADLKSLSELSNEMKDLAARARAKRLAPREFQGGTTSISNLGMFGIRQFDAVINPPQATILAVGAAEDRTIVVNRKQEVATMMTSTLSCDHRVVDGAIGAALLAAFKGYIESPVRMLV
jgi:pyruvate dehydrogenase E2 component (dihydrolipoamide acetyltransferase)